MDKGSFVLRKEIFNMCENCKHELEGKYDPKSFEEEIYENWEKNGYFKPSGDKTKESY